MQPLGEMKQRKMNPGHFTPVLYHREDAWTEWQLCHMDMEVEALEPLLGKRKKIHPLGRVPF